MKLPPSVRKNAVVVEGTHAVLQEVRAHADFEVVVGLRGPELLSRHGAGCEVGTLLARLLKSMSSTILIAYSLHLVRHNQN